MARITQAIWAAPPAFPASSQTEKMPVVSVCTPKKSTVPKSLTVSIMTIAVPAAMAGRAKGIPMAQNRRKAPAPKARANFMGAAGLFAKPGPRQQIDIGIK